MKLKKWALAAALAAVLAVAGILALATGRSGKAAPGQAVQITELCAGNTDILADHSGKYRDYIELYAPQGANLKGYTLCKGELAGKSFGDIILAPGEYRAFFLGKDSFGFSLDAAGGEELLLKDPSGKVVARVTTRKLAENQALLLSGGAWRTGQPSPNFANDAQGLAAFRLGEEVKPALLAVSEVLTANESTLPDELGAYSDVVELTNLSQSPVYLGSYFLSDSTQNRFAYRLPDRFLQPGEYLTLYCDGENYISAGGYIHANFSLSRGESLVLTAPGGAWWAVTPPAMAEDTAWLLSDQGDYICGDPSPGFANTAQGIAQAQVRRIDPESPLVITEISLSQSGIAFGGNVGDFVEITNRSEQALSTQGWFLSDGGDPYRCSLPQQLLQPGQSLVIACNEAAGFSLAEGERVVLTGPDYRHAPKAFCAEAAPGKTLQLAADGEGWVTDMPSLGFANTDAARESYAKASAPQGLRISEVMSANSRYLPGPTGSYCDWVELYNAGESAVQLKNYSLFTRPDGRDAVALPDITLSPGKYVLLLLNNTGEPSAQGYYALSLGLSAEGEGLYLAKGAAVEDFVILPALAGNTSYGRSAESLEFSLLSAPTPGKANAAKAQPSAAPVALTAPGSYDGVQSLQIVLQGQGQLYYTTNCTAPNRSSTPYTGPITVSKTTVLRVVCYEPGKDASPVADFSYFINENDSLPVVSIVTDPDNLFDHYTGIYANGPGMGSQSPYYGANFWKDWEYPASVTLIETDGSRAFSVSCGIRIFGGFSRANEKKSFACVFRNAYGLSQLEYPLFEGEDMPYYESFVLRAGGQDIYHARMRDETITSLAGEHLDLPVQAYRPVNLYLDGRYWGVYYLREKLNEQYVAGHYGMPVEDVTVCQTAGTSFKAYVEVTRYARTHDLSRQEHYDYIASRVDIENYTDYMIAQMWINNTDNSNVKFFMNDQGKWTWALFDTDMSMFNPSANTLYRNLHGLDHDSICRSLLVQLLKNEAYRDYFLQRAAYQVSNVWTEENVNRRIDEISGLIRQDMQKDTARWNKSYTAWQRSVETMHSFANQRNRYFIRHIQNYFDLTPAQMEEYGFPAED